MQSWSVNEGAKNFATVVSARQASVPTNGSENATLAAIQVLTSRHGPALRPPNISLIHLELHQIQCRCASKRSVDRLTLARHPSTTHRHRRHNKPMGGRESWMTHARTMPRTWQHLTDSFAPARGLTSLHLAMPSGYLNAPTGMCTPHHLPPNTPGRLAIPS